MDKRQILFNPNWMLSGISTCVHKTRTMMTSILYSAQFSPNAKALDILDKHKKTTPDSESGTDTAANRCTSLPEAVVSNFDCEIFDEQN